MAPIGEAASLFSGKNFAFMQYDKKGINIGAFNITGSLFWSLKSSKFTLKIPFTVDQEI